MKSYLGIGCLFILLACNNKAEKSVETKDTTATKNIDTAVSAISFKNDTIQRIYSSYIGLKDALVATQFEETKQKAKVLADQLKIHNGCENTAIIASNIEKAKDITEQRKQFTALNSDLIALFKHTELSSGTIYIQHCPMANKGDGGDWLASEKKIQNPYYGDEMMECGSVIEEIKIK